MTSVPPALRQRYQEGRLVPFVGAGASMSVSWSTPTGDKRGLSWSELVDEAAQLLGVDEPELLRVRGNDLQILEYYRLKNSNEVAELRNWFTINMNPPDHALLASPIHASLSKLTKCNLIYTTNYDDFIERALSLNGRQPRTVAVEAHIAKNIMDVASGHAMDVEVVKFHGDLNNPSRMVLSESDYENRLKFNETEDQRFMSDLLGRALLFIGYSFRDWNVSYLFRMVNESFGPLPEASNGRRGYITVVEPSDFEYKLFEARNIDVIPIRAAHIRDDIAELLAELL